MSLNVFYLSDIQRWLFVSRESIERRLQTSIILPLVSERRVFDNCRKRNLLARHNTNLARVVRQLWRRFSYRYVLLTRWRSSSLPAGRPTVCRNHNSSCGSCDDVEHRWLTSGRAINRARRHARRYRSRPATRRPASVPLIVGPPSPSTDGPPRDLPLYSVRGFDRPPSRLEPGRVDRTGR